MPQCQFLSAGLFVEYMGQVHMQGTGRPEVQSAYLMVCLQVSYDLLDTYPGGPYKSRGGSIKKTRFVEEEEEDEDEDDDEQDQVQQPLNAFSTASSESQS